MKPGKRSKLVNDILRIVGVTVFFAVVAYVLQLPYVRTEILDIQQWRTFSQSYGRAGQLVLVGIFGLATGCGIPRLWISAAAGALYGAVVGSVLAQVATLLGATINFFIGRWALRGPFKRLLSGRFKVWYDRFGENGFRWIFYVRLFPLGNATLVNLVSGASKVRYLDFLAATFLGYLPFTIVFALFGSSAAKHKTSQLILGTVLFTLVVFGRWLFRRLRTVEEELSVEDRA